MSAYNGHFCCIRFPQIGAGKRAGSRLHNVSPSPLPAACDFPKTTAGVQQMDRDKIKVDHCYSMTPIKGRRTIARVTNLFRITAVAAYEEIGTETLELNPIVVRFVWRYAAYPTGWSTRRRQLMLDDFLLAAEKEVVGP
jgi:hypothetical protein